MNNRGQVIFFTFMLAFTIIILALALAGPTKELVDDARNAGNLDCANESISTFDKGACIVSDLSTFQYIGGLIFIAGMVLAARVVI